jgi:hypothetical protein
MCASLQEFNLTRPSPQWFRLKAAGQAGSATPHATVLGARETAPGTAVDCADYSPEVEISGPEDYPSLEAMICSLVLKGGDGPDYFRKFRKRTQGGPTFSRASNVEDDEDDHEDHEDHEVDEDDD